MATRKETPIEAQTEDKNVLSAAKLTEWKKQYGHIYRTVVGDTTVIWHKLNRKQYVETMTTQDSVSPETKIFDRQDMICRTCVLFPEDIDALIEENGGLSGAIADEVLLKSGFDVTDTEEI